MRARWLGMLLLCLLAIASIRLAGEEAGPSGDTEAATAMAQAAQKAYQSTVAAYEAGTADVEDVYTWSKRLMNTEGKASKGNHLARMEHLYKHVAKLHDEARRGGEAEKFHATQFYVAEAKVMLRGS